MKYLAHINHEDGREQTLIDHLKGTAQKAEYFASAFGEGDLGKIAGMYHDVGKYSSEFQKYLKNGGGKKTDHSTAGANLIMGLKNRAYIPIAFIIASHHTGLVNCGNSFDTSSESTFYGRIKRKAGEDFPKFSAYKEEMEEPLNNIKSTTFSMIKNNFSAQFYIRMLFSCLVDADFLDTENFMQNNGINRGNYPDIFELKNRFDYYIKRKFLSTKNLSEINKKRCDILKECIEKGENSSENIFSLTVPTGGGKTISSMAFALNYAIKNNKNRIIYVIPYTSIIEQNAKVFRDILGNDAVVEHHSNISFNPDENTDSIEYEILKKSELATENWDAPIIVTTNVQFFESLYACKSSKCRKLHNIANSVVVFDEAQMIPTENILPCVYAIAELVKLYKTTAILCTATQPSLDKIFFDKFKITVNEISKNTEENYNFFKRNNIRVLKEKLSLEDLSDKMKNDKQALCIVNSKKAAKELFESLSSNKNVFYLSTNLCAKHRRNVIKTIKDLLYQNEDCLVVSTSLIEAGVDIDFPKIYRELSGLDSIIQSAGRCNREGKFNKNDSYVYVFEWEDSELEYKGKDLRSRIDAAKYVLEKDYESLDCLEAIKCYFDYLHKFDGGGLDKRNIIKLTEDKPCNFKDFDKEFVMIEENTIPVFIPFDEQGNALLSELKTEKITRNLIRKTGAYLVNIYKNKFDKMLAANHIEYVSEDEKFAYLRDKKYYDENFGILQEVQEGEGIFL